MIAALPGLDARLVSALAESPSRIPVLLGPCGSGRTCALQRVRDGLPAGSCQYIDVERVMSSPEQFLGRVTAESPFHWKAPAHAPAGPREAYEHVLAYFTSARAGDGGPATFLLDEAFDLRLFESFPGLSEVMPQTLDQLASSGNHFALATKYETRALRTLRTAPDRYLVVHAEPVPASGVAADLMQVPGLRSDEAEETARIIVALTDGRAAYVAALVGARGHGPSQALDPIAALTALLSPGGTLHARCRFSYEMRLHRARGYGALKAVLGVLAEEEPLTLTEIAGRVQRTPGSTRDYLGWLEDVDLVCAQRKRYAFADPLLRVWVRLNSRCAAADEHRTLDEIQRYAVARLSAGSVTAR
ncbi:MAG: hypothetical protein MUE61_10940 [Vicinamibacterales bacterium]|jgi:hypothetical protein|nr:hypothetical protein [Vicinamibacterales bacterium]